MTDKTSIIGKNKIVVSTDGKTGFAISLFLNTNNAGFILGIDAVDGRGGCVEEKSNIYILFVDGSRLTLTNQSEFNCDGKLRVYFGSGLDEMKSLYELMSKRIQAMRVFTMKTSIEEDFSHPAVLVVTQTAKKVWRESHRMQAFVRFQKTSDELYYAIIEPDHNVLPLIASHFKNRYADQRWMIYDGCRKYGISYDLEQLSEVELNFVAQANGGKNVSSLYDEKEELYQQLWQQYYKSVNIAARKNTKLHVQHMPVRYWKYLPEKMKSW
jgi:probable DNA metabolism protein